MKLTSQQEAAVKENGRNIIVSAGAGSGKTKVLSERVFKHVNEDHWDIDKMLVLTFTNAAAAEMKKRIRERLTENDDLSVEEKKRQLNKIDSSFIMTFDAYALFLVKKYNQLLGVDDDIMIADNNLMVIKRDQILNEILEEEYQKRDKGFIQIINSFCVKNDDNIRSAIVLINNKLNSLYDREAFVDNYEKNFYSNEAIERMIAEYEAFLLDKIAILRNKINELSEFVENIGDYYLNIDDVFASQTYSAIKNSVDRLEITKKRLPNNSGASELKKEIKTFIDKLREYVVFDGDTLKSQYLSTRDNVLCLLSLAQRLNEGLNNYKKAKNIFEFSDVFKMAIDVVAKHKDVCLEIRDYFKEILIDEYQDTNDLQEEFIKRIAYNNVYMVGDVKQSIYQFRNANPLIFTNKYGDYRQGLDGMTIDLTNNFRSRKEVLNDINIIFRRLMTRDIGGADYVDGHQLNAGNLAYEENGKSAENYNMEILSYDYDKKEYPFTVCSQAAVEAIIIAKDICDKIRNKYQIYDGNVLRPVDYRDFAILIDRSTNFDLFKEILTYYQIPTAIEQEEKMSDSDLMAVIRSIFKFLACLKKEDYGYDFVYSYVSIERSFLREYPDSLIYDVICENKIKESELYNILYTIYRDIDVKSLSEILDEIMAAFNVYTKLNKIGEVKANIVKIDYLYQLAHSLAALGQNYLDFNEYLSQIFKNDNDIKFNMQTEDENAVKITTIHKSKGLEYSVVYYPGLYVKFNRQEENDSFVFSKEDGLIIPSMIEGRGLKNTFNKDLYKYKFDKNDIGEKIRLFYVALTRAKEKMILVCPLEDKSQGGTAVIDDDKRLSMICFKDFLDNIYSDLTDYIRPVDYNDYDFRIDFSVNDKDLFKKIGSGGKYIQVKEKLNINAKIVEESSFSKKAGLIDSKQRAALDFGTRIHYYLETLDFRNPQFDYLEPLYLEKIRAFLDGDLMKEKDKAVCHKEYEFIYDDHGQRKHGVIDLLMEYEDHFDIIDYKLKNIDDNHYHEQLNGYRQYISSISNKKVNCYLYSVVDSKYEKID